MLRSLLEGRRRTWTVIILIALVLLVLGLPAVDDYIALRQRERELSAAYRDQQSQLQLREQLDQHAGAVEAALAQMSSRSLTNETENEFRQQIVELTRGSSCQLRRLSLDTANLRPWLKDDHPLRQPERGRNRKKQEESATGFALRSQIVSLTASGTPVEIRELLGAIASTSKLMHTRSLSIRPVGSDRGAAVMELQFIVFGLTKAKRTKPAA